jgi:ribonuclease P protein component
VTTTGRLRGRRTFAAIAQQGRTVRSGPLRVRYVVASAHEAPAVGFAISKKTGGAVVRNRIRRRLRAAVAASVTPVTSGFYLISADTAAATVPFADLTVAVDAAFTKAASEAQR